LFLLCIPLYKRGIEGDFEISPSPSFIKRGSTFSPFVKGGQRGISEIHPSLPFVKEGDLKLQGNFKKSPPTPLFPPTILPLYKRGIKGDFTKEGDLKLEGNFVKRGE